MPWGRAAAVVLNLSTATYMLVLAVASIMNARSGGDGAGEKSVRWMVIGFGCLAGGLALMRRRTIEVQKAPGPDAGDVVARSGATIGGRQIRQATPPAF